MGSEIGPVEGFRGGVPWRVLGAEGTRVVAAVGFAGQHGRHGAIEAAADPLAEP